MISDFLLPPLQSLQSCSTLVFQNSVVMYKSFTFFFLFIGIFNRIMNTVWDRIKTRTMFEKKTIVHSTPTSNKNYLIIATRIIRKKILFACNNIFNRRFSEGYIHIENSGKICDKLLISDLFIPHLLKSNIKVNGFSITVPQMETSCFHTTIIMCLSRHQLLPPLLRSDTLNDTFSWQFTISNLLKKFW